MVIKVALIYKLIPDRMLASDVTQDIGTIRGMLALSLSRLARGPSNLPRRGIFFMAVCHFS